MDPGPHTLEATAPAHPPFRTTFRVADGDPPATVVIDLGRSGAPIAHAAEEPAQPGGGGRTQRTVALVVAGAGVLGVGVGAAFGVTAMSTWSRARSECTSGVTGCSPDALRLESVVRSDALASTIAFTAGAAGLAAGAILWFTAPSLAPSPRSGYVLLPISDGQRFALELSGRF
jgi:hypothetical protein